MKITKKELKELVKEVLQEKKLKESMDALTLSMLQNMKQKGYASFFNAALKKAGKPIPKMSDEEKKNFFNKIDAAWNARGEKKESKINEESNKFIAKFNGKTIEIQGKDLWDATQKARVQLKVPKSKYGLLSVHHENYYKNQDFRYESKVNEDDCGCGGNKVNEDGKLQGGGDGPCWKGYEMVGMKKGAGGKDVPNCVPKNESKINEASIWHNPKKAEPLFKKIGLKVPPYPKQGDVFWKGKKVGRIDNFNGLVTYDKNLIKVLWDNRKEYDLGIWNPDDPAPKGFNEEVNDSEYKTFFKKALEKTGKDKITSMSDEEKKEFFNKVDAAWKAKGEKPEVSEMNPAMTAMIARQTMMNPQTKKKIKASSAASDPDNPLYDKAKALIQKIKDRFSKKESVNEKFNKAQLDLLKTAYANINKINPSSEAYKKLIALLDRLDKSDLEQLSTADIKFVSMLAKNRLVKNEKNESVNEARTVSKPIKVDNDTMVQIVGDDKGFRELTAALNPKTGKPIQKFGFDRGNETAESKEELIKKLQKKYGKGLKF